MAPTRRSRKRGNTRMDAALDAMSPYGFPSELVRRTVDQLLKVYGGDEGWVFIEDAAYTLLIETLLEKQTMASEAPLEDGLIQDNPGDGHNEASTAGCSSAAVLPCSNTQASDAASQTNAIVGTVSAATETGNQLPIQDLDTVSAAKETDCRPAGNLALGEVHGLTLAYSPPQTKSPQPVESLCHKRRRPCYGWISSDEEEEGLLQLPPASLSQIKKMFI